MVFLGRYTSMAMAFGQTGSGKTHTMTGPPSDLNNQVNITVENSENKPKNTLMCYDTAAFCIFFFIYP